MNNIIPFRELSEAAAEEYERHMLALMKQRHHHTDGSPVELHVVQESGGIEHNLQEEMERFRQQQETARSEAVFSSQQQQPQEARQPPEEEIGPRAPQKIVAGCNCGQTLVATPSRDRNSVQLATYDAGSGGNGYGNLGSGEHGSSYNVPSSSEKKQDYL